MPARLPSAVASAVCLGCVLSRSFVDALRTNDIPSKQTSNGARDLVFMHIPINFGHTIEEVALLDPVPKPRFSKSPGSRKEAFVGRYMLSEPSTGRMLHSVKKPNAEHWGLVYPGLKEISNVTGCPMYLTPQKHWPEDLAKKYFGDKKVFGLVHDPYDRMIALFRGESVGSARKSSKSERESCDLNSKIKEAMRALLSDTTGRGMFSHGCAFIPQAEYFEGKYGITVPVNNRAFPESALKVFKDHGYDDIVIRQEDIMHASECPDTWAGDLDEDTKALVRKWFSRDFKVLCDNFGYCDEKENTCIPGVDQMCPQRVLEKKLVHLEPKSAQASGHKTFSLSNVFWDLAGAKRPGVPR